MEPTKTTATAIVSLVKMHNETLGILREIVSRRREFLDATSRGAEECKRAADECHAAICEAEQCCRLQLIPTCGFQNMTMTKINASSMFIKIGLVKLVSISL